MCVKILCIYLLLITSPSITDIISFYTLCRIANLSSTLWEIADLVSYTYYINKIKTQLLYQVSVRVLRLIQSKVGKVGNVTPVQELYKCRKPNSYKNIKILGLVMEAESADLQKFLMEKLVPTTFSPSP